MGIELKMAWRNIGRNPRRSFLTLAAIAFATLLLIFMLSWQFGSYEAMINSAIKIHTGHLQVQAKGYLSNKEIRLTVPHPAKIEEILKSIPGVVGCTARASAFSLVSSSDRTYGAVVIGIDPLQEARVSTLPNLLREGSFLTEDDVNQALVGRLLAQNLHVGIGDELVVLGQGRDGSVAATILKIKGIYSSGQDDFDRSSIQVPLSYFQDTFFMNGSVHEIVVLGKSLEIIPEIQLIAQKKIAERFKREKLVVLNWKELMPGLVEVIKLDLFSGFIFYFILIVVVAFSILNTFLMSIFERTREFGVLLAIGTTPGRLSRLLILESVTMTFVGILAGILIGSLVTWYFQVYGFVISGAGDLMRQYGMPERIYPQLSMLSISIGAGAVMIITIVTALYPALRVWRLRPVEALTAA